MTDRQNDNPQRAAPQATPDELSRWHRLVGPLSVREDPKVQDAKAALSTDRYDSPQVLDTTIERVLRAIDADT